MYLLEEFNIPALVCLLLVWSISGMLILGRLFTIEEDCILYDRIYLDRTGLWVF